MLNEWLGAQCQLRAIRCQPRWSSLAAYERTWTRFLAGAAATGFDPRSLPFPTAVETYRFLGEGKNSDRSLLFVGGKMVVSAMRPDGDQGHAHGPIVTQPLGGARARRGRRPRRPAARRRSDRSRRRGSQREPSNGEGHGACAPSRQKMKNTPFCQLVAERASDKTMPRPQLDVCTSHLSVDKFPLREFSPKCDELRSYSVLFLIPVFWPL
jgi:hypothetical protein